MPNVLAKLGLEVLAVNPFVSTAGVMRADLDEHAARRRRPGAHVGLAARRRDRSRRRAARLIDDEGHVLTDTEALLAILTLLPGNLFGDRVALPVTTTRQGRGAAGRRTASVSPGPSSRARR